MKISLQNAGKRFNREWVFRRFSYNFIQGNSYAITGNNGSGKSTISKLRSVYFRSNLSLK
jgi:ABC-type Mn2+/Zn2+ transport system ATPase subunit